MNIRAGFDDMLITAVCLLFGHMRVSDSAHFAHCRRCGKLWKLYTIPRFMSEPTELSQAELAAS